MISHSKLSPGMSLIKYLSSSPKLNNFEFLDPSFNQRIDEIESLSLNLESDSKT